LRPGSASLRLRVLGYNDAVIANACESAPYRIATDVQLRDQFWIKAQPYSLFHMMDGDPLVDRFVGGTIYQAFLSALSYHRWHSPVSGRIVKTRLIDGSYYAESLAQGFDPAGPNESQGYITQVAARALIFIEADNPDIGLMAVMFVGMAEVSQRDHGVRRSACPKGRPARDVPLRRLHPLPDLPAGSKLGVRPARPDAGTALGEHPAPGQNRRCHGQPGRMTAFCGC